jgi:hypothetical protein
MEFLEAIAETIYVLRPKFEAMKKRREKPIPGATPTSPTNGADGALVTNGS